MIYWSFGFTQQSPAWWSPGPLGLRNTDPPGDLLVLRVHPTITRLVISWSFWVHTTTVISWSFGFTQHWWTPGLLGSHNTDPPGDLLVLRVQTTITRLVISWSLGFTQQSLPGDLLVLRVHTTIICLVISWSLGFTQQSLAWWSPGPLCSHNTDQPGDLLVLWVYATLTRLVISWSFGFTQHWPVWWSPGP